MNLLEYIGLILAKTTTSCSLIQKRVTLVRPNLVLYGIYRCLSATGQITVVLCVNQV